MSKQLKRLPNDKIIFGICSGLAQYFEIDKTVVRIIIVLIFCLSGFFPVGLLYIIAYVINNKTTGAIIMIEPIPPVMIKLLNDGGLVEHIKKNGDFDLV